MSGFEVVGVVLGGLPLIVSALENYGNGTKVIRRWGRYRWEMQRLMSNVCTEEGLFRNTCEKLLSGIVATTELERLLRDSRGPLWKDPEIRRRLEGRLCDSYENYVERMDDMKLAVEDFKLRLDLGADGKACFILFLHPESLAD
jgi:hypothetical protein